ncbi:class I SAM-dependent methyltransferase [Acidihalobacter prosperus]|uniref:Methyltransferase type 12 n=1 Tax=Acidihalobacter prosperus TaxID=160660 RepID=A0A1A6C1G8_9GAMM|nr:class I SAM-dependent methyltransferase [Acidihalobacter prosperus]OBS08394.1 methyltransferase type 12 [Acidihalobacter prosperus]
MQRIPEPELMLDEAQAKAYAEADFEAPHTRVIELFRESFPDWSGSGDVLDLGCGPGDISLRFAAAYPRCRVDGIDGSEAMMAAGRARIEHAGLADRVHLHKALLPADRAPMPRYDAVISNSLLHHLHDPQVLWTAVKRYAAPGAPVFVVDLLRPRSREQALAMRDRYAAGEPAVLQEDFYNSLCAAFTLDEIGEQLREAGLEGFAVRAVSDRHCVIHGRGR